MARTLSEDIEFLHSYFVASDLKDLNAAFEDGKKRAINALDKRLVATLHQIDRVKIISLADYNRHYGIANDHANDKADGGGHE